MTTLKWGVRRLWCFGAGREDHFVLGPVMRCPICRHCYCDGCQRAHQDDCWPENRTERTRRLPGTGGAMSDLTFREFQRINQARCLDGFKSSVDDWPPEIWGLAIAGEAGELCNLLKKVYRGDFSIELVRHDVFDEIADILTYCDLLVTRLQGDTEKVLAHKFNEVSDRVGSDVKL